MLPVQEVPGSQEIWADYITNREMESTPFLDWIRQGKAVAVKDIPYQADRYRAPRENSHVDGTPVTGFEPAGEGRETLRSTIMYSTAAAVVSMLHEDATSIAGVASEMGRETVKQTKEMARDMEAWLLDVGDCREDNQVKGYATRSVGSWLSQTAQTTFPVPANFRPPAASVPTVVGNSLTETDVLNMLESIGTITKSREEIMGFVGTRLKRAFNNMTFLNPSQALLAGGTPAPGAINYTGPLSDRAINRVVNRYESDFGPLGLVVSYFNMALTGSAFQQSHTGFFLHRSMWELRWYKKPTWKPKAYEGGQYQQFCESVFMVLCLNPVSEGGYLPATAS